MAATDRKTQRINVWLTPEQVEWLKKKKNASEAVRALITEAMAMENLAKSVRRPRPPTRPAADRGARASKATRGRR